MRTVAPETRAAIRNNLTRPCILFYCNHPSGVLRLWNGYGTLPWNGYSWQPAGLLVQVTALEQTTELQVTKLQFVLAGVTLSDEAKAIALSPSRRFPVTMWRALLDRRLQVIRDPIVWFRGYGDPPTLQDKADGTSTITLGASGAIFNLVKPRRTQLSHNEQQNRFPGDTGLRFQAAVAQSQKQWTIGAYNSFSPPA